MAAARAEEGVGCAGRLGLEGPYMGRTAEGAGRIPPRLSPLIAPHLALPEAETVLDTLTRAPDASLALMAFNPHADGYVNLRSALAKLRAEMIAPSPAKTEGAGDAQLASVSPEPAKGRRGPPPAPAAQRARFGPSPERVETGHSPHMQRLGWRAPQH